MKKFFSKRGLIYSIYCIICGLLFGYTCYISLIYYKSYFDTLQSSILWIITYLILLLIFVLISKKVCKELFKKFKDENKN
mgnify:CR=1 FL=1